MNKDIVETYQTLEESYQKISNTYLKITESNVDEALTTHTTVYAFFASVLTYAKSVRDGMAYVLENIEAVKKELCRIKAQEKGQKTTNAGLDTLVKTFPEVDSAKKELLKAETKYNYAKNIVDSLNHQKDCLIQLSANKRAEVKSFHLN